jgi:putative copper export protein
VVFRLFVLPRAEFPEAAFRDAADRTRNLAGAVLLLFVIAAAMRFRAALEMMPATPLTGPGALGIGALMSGAWALAWLVVFAGAVIVMLSLFVARRSVIGWFLAILGITTICAGEALTGHAGSLANNGSIGVVADVAHFLGAGGWIGGLACVVLCGLPAVRVAEPVLRDVAASRLVRAYHRLAFECVAVVLVSAVIAAWLRLNAISDLWTTAYGSLLFRKIIFVLVVLGLGTYHWRAVVIPDWDPKTARRFRWTAAIELIVGAVVIAFTTFLVSTALPNHP